MVEASTTQEQLQSRARQVIPSGVQSNVRVNGPRPFVDHAKGAWMWDVTGKNYVDHLLGQGPNFLGHASDAVSAAVAAACRKGTIFGGQHELEVRAAEAFLDAVGWADRVRFAMTGSEADHAALRLARATTGRRKVIRFEGHYHGWLDNVLMAASPDGSTTASSGQPPGALSDLIVLPWNDIQALTRAFADHSHEIAAVITEPVMVNNGSIMPVAGYLQALRTLCTEYGSVLIFDEVITGFRLALGGAAEYFGVEPDLATYGKAMAGGWPSAAIAGRAELMDEIRPGAVNHSGTFNGSVVSMSATAAAIAELRRDPPYERVFEHGAKLMEGLAALARTRGIDLHVQGPPPAFFTTFGRAPDPVDYLSLQRFDQAGYAAFTERLVAAGVWVAQRGVWYVSAAHGERELTEALARADIAFATLGHDRVHADERRR